MRGCSVFTAGKKTCNAERPTSNAEIKNQSSRLGVRGSAFGVFLHPFRNFDPEKLKAALQNASGQIAQREPRTARRFVGLQDRAGFVKRMEGVCELEQIIRQNVRPKIAQHLRHHLGKLTETLSQMDLGGLVQNE